MVKRSNDTAVTLVELMVTLVIVGIVLSTALITMRGYIPKQRLISSVGYMDNIVQQAQTEAGARSYWTCIKFTAGPPLQAKIYVDTNGNRVCGENADKPLPGVSFKDGVGLGSGAGCTENITPSCVVWFDTTGVPKICNGDTGCGSSSDAVVATLGAGVCVDHTFQIVFSSSDLDSQAKARELEILSGGMVKTVKPDDKGLDTSFWANSVANSGGCE